MDSEPASTLGLVLVVVLAAISMGLLLFLVKGPVERMIGRFMDRSPSGERTGRLTRTFSFTFGSPPDEEMLAGTRDLSAPTAAAASLDLPPATLPRAVEAGPGDVPLRPGRGRPRGPPPGG